MNKKFLIYILSFAAGMFLIYQIHIKLFTFSIPFAKFLKLNYIYLASFTVIVCFSLVFLHGNTKFKHRLGFLYLFSVPLKIIFFIVFFKRQFFGQNFNSTKELLNVLIVIFLTLFFETLFVSRLLNNSNAAKNVE